MFGPIFKPYGLVWTVLNTITDVLGLSLLWCVCSLPVFTIGASTTALYDAAVHGIRYKEEGTYRRFFRTFKAELKTGTAVTAVWGVALGFCFFVLAALNAAAKDNGQAAMMAGAYRVLMLLPMGIACWSCAVLSRFTYGFRDLTVTAFRFCVVHLPSTAAIAAVTWLCGWYCTDSLLPFAFAPAVTALIWSVFAERVFKKYGGEIRVQKPEEDSEEQGENES